RLLGAVVVVGDGSRRRAGRRGRLGDRRHVLARRRLVLLRNRRGRRPVAGLVLALRRRLLLVLAGGAVALALRGVVEEVVERLVAGWLARRPRFIGDRDGARARDSQDGGEEVTA